MVSAAQSPEALPASRARPYRRFLDETPAYDRLERLLSGERARDGSRSDYRRQVSAERTARNGRNGVRLVGDERLYRAHIRDQIPAAAGRANTGGSAQVHARGQGERANQPPEYHRGD